MTCQSLARSLHEVSVNHYLDSQVAQNKRPAYPKAAHVSLKVARNFSRHVTGQALSDTYLPGAWL